MILICAVVVASFVVVYWLYYYLRDAWQLLAVAVCGLISLVGLGLSVLLVRRRRSRGAAYMTVLSIALVLGVVPLLIGGLTPYVAVSGVLLILVTGLKLVPRLWPLWLAVAVAFVSATWLADRFSPVPRYVLDTSQLPDLYLLGAIAVSLAAIVSHGVLARLKAFTSIRARLFLTCVMLVLFAGGAVSYLSTVVLMHTEQREAVERLTAVATHKETEVNNWADGLQQGLSLFVDSARQQLATVLTTPGSANPSYADALEHLQSDLVDTFTQNRLYDGLYVMDTSGKLIASAGSTSRTLLPEDAECVRQASPGDCLQPPRYYRSLGQAAVVAISPVIVEDGRLAGFVAGYADLDALNAIAAESDLLGNAGTTYMVGAGSTLLTKLHPAQYSAATAGSTSVIRSQGIDTVLGGRSSGSGFYTDFRGVPVVGVYRWLPKLSIGLIAEQNRQDALEQSTMLTNLHLAITLLLLAAAALAALYIVRSITAPLGHLAATAEQIAEGAVDLTAVVKQDDEIGALARVFNRMTARLLQANDQLEQRSSELAQANSQLQEENTVRRQAEEAVQLERNKLKSILDTMEDWVYIVDNQYRIEYTNPTMTRKLGPLNGQRCFEYLYGRSDPCPWCPNDQVWKGVSVRREETFSDGAIYEVLDAPLPNANGTLSKLALFHNVTDRKHAEQEILQRNRELAALSRRLVEIQESERQYIARELHDETAQALTSLMLRLGILERDLRRGAPLADRMTDLKGTIVEVIEGLHDLAVDLRPPSLDHVGLVPALRQYAERITEQQGLAVDFGAIGLDDERLAPDMEVAIYRIVQEALSNAVRHSQATHADVVVERRAGLVRVIVEDNGVGFDPAEATLSGRLGLVGMRERTQMLGGQLTIDSAPGAGTTVVAEVPYDNSTANSR